MEIKRCKFLRAKNGYGTMEGGDSPFLPTDYGTTYYWCVQTCSPVGPDDQPAYTDCCTEERLCFTEMRIEQDQTPA